MGGVSKQEDLWRVMKRLARWVTVSELAEMLSEERSLIRKRIQCMRLATAVKIKGNNRTRSYLVAANAVYACVGKGGNKASQLALVPYWQRGKGYKRKAFVEKYGDSPCALADCWKPAMKTGVLTDSIDMRVP